MSAREPTVTFRVDHANAGHVTLTVFVGRNPGARGRAGQLVLRTDELVELLPDPGSADVLARLGAGDQLTLRGPITGHTDDSADVLGAAWRHHHGVEASP